MRPFARGRRPFHAEGNCELKWTAEGTKPGQGMKITKIEQFHVDCGWEIYSFLKLNTDEGVTGWSEFREHRRPGIAAAIRGMGELLIGQDPRAIGRLDAALY